MASSFLNTEFDFFFNSYYKAVYFFACKFLKDEYEVEDIVLESFVKVWESREKFANEVKAKAYLYKCVYTGCLKEVRRETSNVKKKNGLAIVSDEFEKDCLHGMIAAETIHLLYEAMNELPAQCKKVFTKLYVEGKSVADTAAEIGVAVSTVKAQKARGVMLIMGKLKVEG